MLPSDQTPLFAPPPPQPDPLSQAVSDSADRLASGIVYRLEHLAEKEQRVRDDAGWETLPNMPARLIWEAFEPGAAAFFVVYKLMHEVRSELPKVYRAIAWSLCAAQPERFGLVTYREQLWDMLASVANWPDDLSEQDVNELRDSLLKAFKQGSNRHWWGHREKDRERDAAWIARRLIENPIFLQGFKSLRRLQMSEQSAITAGNVIMHIPQDLETMANAVCVQGAEGHLLSMEELEAKVASLADNAAERGTVRAGSHHPVPFDLITLDAEDHLRVFALTRQKASDTDKLELRRRLIYLRFFAHYTFGRRSSKKVTIAAAFYADKTNDFSAWLPTEKKLFNPPELWSFEDFWNCVAGRENGGKLVEKITDDAANILRAQDLTTKLRKFVAGQKESEQS